MIDLILRITRWDRAAQVIPELCTLPNARLYVYASKEEARAWDLLAAFMGDLVNDGLAFAEVFTAEALPVGVLLEMAQSDYVILADDCWLPPLGKPNWAEELCRMLEDRPEVSQIAPVPDYFPQGVPSMQELEDGLYLTTRLENCFRAINRERNLGAACYTTRLRVSYLPKYNLLRGI
jgi:hypothetical protein